MRTTEHDFNRHISVAPKHWSADSDEPLERSAPRQKDDPRNSNDLNRELDEITEEMNFEWPEFMLAQQANTGISAFALAILFFATLVAFCCMH
jgi:hypothetical protein